MRSRTLEFSFRFTISIVLIRRWAIRHPRLSISESRKESRSTKNWPCSKSAMLPIGVYRAFWNEIFHEPERIKQGCRFAALFLDEFKKAYGNLSKPIEAPTTGRRLDDSLDEFPAGYSLTGLLSST